MDISWRLQRQFFIFTIYSLIILVPTFFIFNYLNQEKISCFDNKKNGEETGIDCGGTCSLQCEESYKPLRVSFAKILNSDKDKYDILAILENLNNDVAFPKIPYKVSVYNSSGDLLLNASGNTSSLPQRQTIVYIPNIQIKQKPKVVDFDLEKYTAVYSDGKTNLTDLKVSTWAAQYSAGENLQVIAELVNSSSKQISNLSVYALLYDETKSVYAVSKTKLNLIKGREKTAIAFTWGKLNKPIDVEFVFAEN